MSIHTNEQFLAAVAAALGETIAFVRRRGFHLDQPTQGGDGRPSRPRMQRRRDSEDDALDLADYGLDWDADDDCPRYRCPRWMRVRRARRRAA